MSSPMNPFRACTLKGWDINIPLNFYSPEKPITITARYMCQTKWDDFVGGGAQASSTRA